MDYFEEYLVSELVKKTENTFLCLFYYHSKRWRLLDSMSNFETNDITCELMSKMSKYDLDINSSFITPDMSIGILSKQNVERIVNRFGSMDVLNDLLSIKYRCLFIYQVFFGYILFASGIEVHDLADKNVNLFYHTGGNVTMCNFDIDLQKWKEHPYNGEKMDIPVFVPIELFHPNNSDETILHLTKYLKDPDLFMRQYTVLNDEMKRIVV